MSLMDSKAVSLTPKRKSPYIELVRRARLNTSLARETSSAMQRMKSFNTYRLVHKHIQLLGRAHLQNIRCLPVIIFTQSTNTLTGTVSDRRNHKSQGDGGRKTTKRRAILKRPSQHPIVASDYERYIVCW